MSKPLALGPHAIARQGIPLKRLPKTDGVYLICFDAPVVSANGRLTTHHYIGWAMNLRRRFEHHQAGVSGSKFMTHINAAGVGWTVTHLRLAAGRDVERRLKNQKHAWRLCPRCNPALRRGVTRPAPTQYALPF
ncbi:MAG TPA: hypothetical protein VGS80_05100 [Ktedonobacterales bacterium]|nr:hypothetical protein [Ktedonobacterales bacterium]